VILLWRAVPASVHWEGLSDGEEEEEDECEFTEGEEDAEPEGDVLAHLMATAENRGVLSMTTSKLDISEVQN
jgi:hypothetical protein